MMRALLLLLVLAPAVAAAPAPFVRPRLPAAPLAPAELVGDWVMEWGDVCCNVTLLPGGVYSCRLTGTRFVGSWGVDHDGLFWFTESCDPQRCSSWRTYAIRLTPCRRVRRHAPLALTGRIEVGGPHVRIRLRKKAPAGSDRK